MDKIIELLENDVKIASVLDDGERKNLNDRITALSDKLGTTGYPFSSKVEARTSRLRCEMKRISSPKIWETLPLMRIANCSTKFQTPMAHVSAAQLL